MTETGQERADVIQPEFYAPVLKTEEPFEGGAAGDTQGVKGLACIAHKSLDNPLDLGAMQALA